MKDLWHDAAINAYSPSTSLLGMGGDDDDFTRLRVAPGNMWFQDRVVSISRRLPINSSSWPWEHTPKVRETNARRSLILESPPRSIHNSRFGAKFLVTTRTLCLDSPPIMSFSQGKAWASGEPELRPPRSIDLEKQRRRTRRSGSCDRAPPTLLKKSVAQAT
mmetsp:Transcript_17322/g.34934  ORF Transcript_17322/g.34934 Transcript_17322/m.34934 type:complete len:162 (-) Transcript_17322:89-574(-)